MPRSDTQKAAGFKLSASQIRAVEGLLAGESVTNAAKRAGVSRETVHRWQRQDFGFQAAYNRGRRKLLEAAEARVVALAHQAAVTIGNAIDKGDSTAALAVLKGLGILTGMSPTTHSEDPYVLREEAEIAEVEARHSRNQRQQEGQLNALLDSMSSRGPMSS